MISLINKIYLSWDEIEFINTDSSKKNIVFLGMISDKSSINNGYYLYDIISEKYKKSVYITDKLKDNKNNRGPIETMAWIGCLCCGDKYYIKDIEKDLNTDVIKRDLLEMKSDDRFIRVLNYIPNVLLYCDKESKKELLNNELNDPVYSYLLSKKLNCLISKINAKFNYLSIEVIINEHINNLHKIFSKLEIIGLNYDGTKDHVGYIIEDDSIKSYFTIEGKMIENSIDKHVDFGIDLSECILSALNKMI